MLFSTAPGKDRRRSLFLQDVSKEPGSIVWDLTTAGKPVADGLYLVLVTTDDGSERAV
ncbi:MAG: hypothetical protein AB1671_26835 [Thermodesulfobacteriota bacterium]